MTVPLLKRRCAVYTRKSSEEGLDQAFNSLDAQREACEAYVLSQKAEGWVLVRDRYDDGGFSGGNLERPGLRRLMADIEAGAVDIVVVYKIDRLTRYLPDFGKLVEVFDRHKVTFVSVTQSFNTTSSAGRMMLNMLLAFAQFEREVIGERIRDKFAASRAKGIWMGGWAPYGYDVRDRKLVVNPTEAVQVRYIFERFVQLGSATLLSRELMAEGLVSKYGHGFDKGYVYRLLTNRVYRGDAMHKGRSHPGQHKAIVSDSLWDRVDAILNSNRRQRTGTSRAHTPALLKGLIFAPNGQAMTPSHTRKRGRLYRYYVTTGVIKGDAGTCPIRRIPAGQIESAVLGQIRHLVGTPEIVVQTWAALRQAGHKVTETEVRTHLTDFETIWAELFPVEQIRLVQLLVARIEVSTEGLAVTLKTEGLTSLIGQMAQRTETQPAPNKKTAPAAACRPAARKAA